MNLAAARDWLLQEAGIEIETESGRSVSGGCIHNAKLFQRTDGGAVFLKSNRAESLAMFEAESDGLKTIAESKTVRVPHPIAVGVIEGSALLAMEGIEMSSRGASASQSKMGEAIALLHRVASPDGKFGFDSDNFIGATPQENGWSNSWADFFTERRLEFQLQLAAKNGRILADSEVVLKKIHAHLSTLEIEPVLLHGDLWGGNASFDDTGNPVIFDPAVYFGDKEADIAFTRMFGGFGSAFYDTYRSNHPAPEPIRETIYNLYHVLNHYNLFGGGYGDQAARMMEEIARKL